MMQALKTVIVSDDWGKHVCYRMVLAQARLNIFVGSWKPILKEEGINTVGPKRGERKDLRCHSALRDSLAPPSSSVSWEVHFAFIFYLYLS